MVKRAEHNVAAKTADGVAMHQTIEYDDALIPTAAEMEKYKAVDPEFVKWFMETGKKEQEHRHKTYDERYEVLRRAFANDRLMAIFYFVTVMFFLLTTTILLICRIEIAGSIFGIFGIVGFLVMTRKYFSKPKQQ